MPETPETGFRELTMADLPQMSRWLRDPVVAEWYQEGDGSLEYIEKHYAPRIRGEEAVRCFVSMVNGVDVGYIQAYAIDDPREQDYAQQLDVTPGAVGIDLFIGEGEYRGKGFGSRILDSFVQQIVFADMQAGYALIAPVPANARAIRSYEHAGFRWIKTVHVIDDEGKPEDEYVMVRYPEVN